MTSESESQSLLGASAGLLPEITPHSFRQTGLLTPAATSVADDTLRNLPTPIVTGLKPVSYRYHTGPPQGAERQRYRTHYVASTRSAALRRRAGFVGPWKYFRDVVFQFVSSLVAYL